jgi:uncharacterized protein (TIGR04222 family)
MEILNPFALHGTDFLMFYAVFSAAILGLLWHRLKLIEARAKNPVPQLKDPYQIAYLRGGANAALHVASVALLDRGLLSVDGRLLQANRERQLEPDRPAIEQAVLCYFQQAGSPRDLASFSEAVAACQQYESDLRRQGLLADAELNYHRRKVALLACLALLAVGGGKIVLALWQGRHNIGYLVGMTAVFSSSSQILSRRKGTHAGNKMLGDLRTLFNDLRHRAYSMESGQFTNELMLVTAVFGITALPATQFPWVKPFLADNSNNNSNSSSCGSDSNSSCSSSSSSSSCSSSSSDSSSSSSCGG